MRAAVIGAGWAGQQHMRAYAELDGVELVAVAALPSDHGAFAAAGRGASRYDSGDVLLAQVPLDVVSVCTPNDLHDPLARAAIARDVAVLCEKPLARSGSEARALVRAARRRGVPLAAVTNWRHVTPLASLLEQHRLGAFGEIRDVLVHWRRDPGGAPLAGAWNRRRDRSGGGVLLDLGPHVFDLFLDLLPPGPWAIRALADGAGGDGCEDVVTVSVGAPGPSRLSVRLSWGDHGAPGHHFAVEVYGATGGASARATDYRWTQPVELYGSAAERAASTGLSLAGDGDGGGTGHREVVEQFLATVRSGSAARDPSLRRAVDVLDVIDSCYRSIATGDVVRVGVPPR